MCLWILSKLEAISVNVSVNLSALVLSVSESSFFSSCSFFTISSISLCCFSNIAWSNCFSRSSICFWTISIFISLSFGDMLVSALISWSLFFFSSIISLIFFIMASSPLWVNFLTEEFLFFLFAFLLAYNIWYADELWFLTVFIFIIVSPFIYVILNINNSPISIFVLYIVIKETIIYTYILFFSHRVKYC